MLGSRLPSLERPLKALLQGFNKGVRTEIERAASAGAGVGWH